MSNIIYLSIKMYGPRLCLPVINVCDVEAPKFARNRRVCTQREKGQMKRKRLGQSSEHFKWLYTNVSCMGNKPEELGILIHN